jgi:hypothetical protein
MRQLVIMSTGWVAFFHLTLDGVHHSPFAFVANHFTSSFFGFWPFFP